MAETLPREGPERVPAASGEDLKTENAFLRRVLEGVDDPIVAVDAAGCIAFSNGAASRAFGYSAEEFRRMKADALFPDEGPGAEVIAGGALWAGEAVGRRKDGGTFPIRLAVACAPPVPAGLGREAAPGQAWTILHIRDIAEQQRMLARLKQLSILDDLTGLYNARYFWARLRYEFVRSIRYQQPLSCLMVDLDRFKAVNDTYGHLSGDAVLRSVSKTLTSSIRAADILARYGGEEFAVILPSTPAAGALRCAEKIRVMVADDTVTVGAAAIRITTSLGVAALGPDLGNEEQLARRADEALLHAKRLGRNQVCLWSRDCPKTDVHVLP